MKPATRITFFVLSLISLLHLLRLVFRTAVTVGGAVVPVWFSIVGLVFFGALASALWREQAAPPAV
jgi:hypothetical protein